MNDARPQALSGTAKPTRSLFARWRDWLKDRSGASAIEFAFLMPILISVYLSSFEITNAYTVAAKVMKAASTVADVVAREDAVTKSKLSDMIEAAEATVAPSSTTGMGLKVTGITIDSAGNASVLWSWNQDGGAPYSVGASVDVPTDMRTPSSFLVHAEVSLPYTILLYLTSAAGLDKKTSSITISREFFYRQRLGDEIACSDCS